MPCSAGPQMSHTTRPTKALLGRSTRDGAQVNPPQRYRRTICNQGVKDIACPAAHMGGAREEARLAIADHAVIR
jgi:hypothetical protein